MFVFAYTRIAAVGSKKTNVQPPTLNFQPRTSRPARAEKLARKKRREEFMTIFIHGKQKRVRLPPTIEGMDVDEFIRRNAAPIWLHQNELWEYMDQGDGF
jgi:hypothetical protein